MIISPIDVVDYLVDPKAINLYDWGWLYIYIYNIFYFRYFCLGDTDFGDFGDFGPGGGIPKKIWQSTSSVGTDHPLILALARSGPSEASQVS